MAAALALAACEVPGVGGGDGPRDRRNSMPLTEPDTRVDQVATGEPGKDRLNWRPLDEQSRTSLGFLTASQPEGRGGPLVLAFANGVTLRLELAGLRKGAEASGVEGQSFAETLNSNREAGVYLYRVSHQDVDKTAVKGGLCGAVTPIYVAISEYVGEGGDWLFKLAAFDSAAPPGDADAADPPRACARYAYRLS